MKKMCCKQMQYYTSNHCTIHNSPFECPDWLLLYEEESDNYGIIIHDGGQSVVKKNIALGAEASFEPPPGNQSGSIRGRFSD